jgi:hypothetical protein
MALAGPDSAWMLRLRSARNLTNKLVQLAHRQPGFLFGSGWHGKAEHGGRDGNHLRYVWPRLMCPSTTNID